MLNSNVNQFLFPIPGGTLSKSINRGFATLFAGALGFGAQHLAILSGKNGEPIVLGILVFLLGKYICLETDLAFFCEKLLLSKLPKQALFRKFPDVN